VLLLLKTIVSNAPGGRWHSDIAMDTNRCL